MACIVEASTSSEVESTCYIDFIMLGVCLRKRSFRNAIVSPYLTITLVWSDLGTRRMRRFDLLGSENSIVGLS